MTADFMPPDLMPALPEMVMLGMTCLVLVVDLFLPQEKRGFTLLLSVLISPKFRATRAASSR